MPSASALAHQLGRPDIWLGRQLAAAPAVATGWPALDQALPGRGWPQGALTELLPATEGIGELSLLLPALRELTSHDRPIVFVRPSHAPYAPALARAGLPLRRLTWIAAGDDADARWAAEQILRENAAGAVLLWSSAAGDTPLRRLQLAAQEGQSLAFLYRPPQSLRQALVTASPAAVRLVLGPAPDALRIQVLKARGGRDGGSVLCPLRSAA
jgi:hypothetical protein